MCSQKQLTYNFLGSLNNANFYPCKVIPLYLIEMGFGKNFKFHPDVDFRDFSLKIFPKILSRNQYYQFIDGVNTYLHHLLFHHQQSINFYGLIKTFKQTINVSSSLIFQRNGINFIGKMFESDAKVHCWEFLKVKYLLSQNMNFKLFQLIHALSREWEESVSMHDGSLENFLFQHHHLMKKNQVLCVNKLNSNELYKMQIIIKYKKPTSPSYFEKIF